MTFFLKIERTNMRLKKLQLKLKYVCCSYFQLTSVSQSVYLYELLTALDARNLFYCYCGNTVILISNKNSKGLQSFY